MSRRVLSCVVLLAAAWVAAGCGSLGQKLGGWKGIAAGEKIAVLPLRDHPSDDPEDTDRTGVICHDIISQAMKAELTEADVDSFVPQSYNSQVGFSREEAIAIGNQRSANYVLFGRCHEFYRVAPMTFRADRGGIDIEVLGLPEGRVVYRLMHVATVTNFATPETAISGIADEMAEELVYDPDE